MRRVCLLGVLAWRLIKRAFPPLPPFPSSPEASSSSSDPLIMSSWSPSESCRGKRSVSKWMDLRCRFLERKVLERVLLIFLTTRAGIGVTSQTGSSSNFVRELDGLRPVGVLLLLSLATSWMKAPKAQFETPCLVWSNDDPFPLRRIFGRK